MSETHEVPAFSLCPLRSPVIPEKEDPQVPFFDPKAPPRQVFGPCLHEGCGMYMATKVDQSTGKILEGMCAFRFNGMAMDLLAGNMMRLVQLMDPSTKPPGAKNPFNLVPKPTG